MKKTLLSAEFIFLKESLTMYSFIDLYIDKITPGITVNTIYVDAKIEFERRGYYCYKNSNA